MLFCLVVVGGFRLVSQPTKSFDLTLRAQSADVTVPVITSGKITLDLENTCRTELIGPCGEADFEGIPGRLRGTAARVLLEVGGFKAEWQQNKLLGNVLDLSLEKADQTVTRLTGTNVSPPEDWKDIRLVVDGQSSEGKVDAIGRFDFGVDGTPGDRIRLKVYTGRKLVYDDFHTLLGPVNLALDRTAQ